MTWSSEECHRTELLLKQSILQLCRVTASRHGNAFISAIICIDNKDAGEVASDRRRIVVNIHERLESETGIQERSEDIGRSDVVEPPLKSVRHNRHVAGSKRRKYTLSNTASIGPTSGQCVNTSNCVNEVNHCIIKPEPDECGIDEEFGGHQPNNVSTMYDSFDDVYRCTVCNITVSKSEEDHVCHMTGRHDGDHVGCPRNYETSNVASDDAVTTTVTGYGDTLDNRRESDSGTQLKNEPDHYVQSNDNTGSAPIKLHCDVPYGNDNEISRDTVSTEDSIGIKAHEPPDDVCEISDGDDHMVLPPADSVISGFKCHICWAVVSDSTALVEHAFSVHRRYACEHCGMSFTQKGNMRRHRVAHTGELPYRCDECRIGYRRREGLKAHLVAWHPNGDNMPATHSHQNSSY